MFFCLATYVDTFLLYSLVINTKCFATRCIWKTFCMCASMCQVSYLWEEIPWLQQCLSPSQSSCSCTLQTRLKMLQAVSQLQVVQWKTCPQHHKLLGLWFCNWNCGGCGNYDLITKNQYNYYVMSLLRECWGLRILVRCILSQSKTSMVTPCWCSWRTWMPVPTWMGFAGHSFANSSSNASPSRPQKSPLPWTCFSSHSMWVLQE